MDRGVRTMGARDESPEVGCDLLRWLSGPVVWRFSVLAQRTAKPPAAANG